MVAALSVFSAWHAPGALARPLVHHAHARHAKPPHHLNKPANKPKKPATHAMSRRGSVAPRYNLPPASRGDRFAPDGLDLRRGVVGWKRFGPLIKRVSAQYGIDPHILGAYVWVESGFNPNQDYRHGARRALGLGSVQAQDHPDYTARQLQDPALNLTLTAREFRYRWQPHDVAGSVMDVWYPAWRRHRDKPLPVIQRPAVYLQAISNRYAALCRIDGYARVDRLASASDR